jgi:hypothetical protein
MPADDDEHGQRHSPTAERMAEILEDSSLHFVRDNEGRFVFTVEQLDNLLIAAGCAVF